MKLFPLILWIIATEVIFLVVLLLIIRLVTPRIFHEILSLFKPIWEYRYLVILLCQNLAIFWSHYFNDYGFPWDFPMGYYAQTAFWTTAVSQGVIPDWMPFQEMGYPFTLALQSGYHYPLLWVFPILHIPYTLNAAVVFQCLHILLGAVGMFFFLRVVLKDTSYALVGAFVFQMFGGFYSNAEHVDIVRAYALVPWMFYVFNFDRDKLWPLQTRNYFIPLILFLLSTGGYPGNLIATVILLTLYCALQMVEFLLKHRDLRTLFLTGLSIIGMSLLGVSMASVHLLPAWTQQEYMSRSDTLSLGYFFGLSVQHWPGLYLSNTIFSEEISMTSTYITLPAFLFIFFVPLKKLKEFFAFGLVGAAALTFVLGPHSAIWLALSDLLYPMRLSRFPASDYRIFIGIMAILVAMLGLQAVIEHPFKKRELATRFLLTFGVLLWGILSSYGGGKFKLDQIARAVTVLFTSMFFVVILLKKEPRFGSIPLLILLAIIGLDGYRVLPEMQIAWRVPGISQVYPFWWGIIEEDGRLLAYSIFEDYPVQRPARQPLKPGIEFAWRGYLIGQFMVNDLSNQGKGILKSTSLVVNNPLYLEYMEKEWIPLLIEPSDYLQEATEISVAEEDLMNALKYPVENSVGIVRQTFYGIDAVDYDVSLSKPLLMVENEKYFPGWTANLTFQDRENKINAVSVNKVFRGWLLPAGNYKMRAVFSFPNWDIYLGISLVAGLFWVIILLVYLVRNRNGIVR